MNELTAFCTTLKKDFTPKIQNPSQPVHCWSEKDILDGKTVDAFVIILRTQGCSWALHSGCTMCGYYNDSLWKPVSDKDLLHQFETVMKRYNGEKIVKIFTSGSFLDDKEISGVVRKKILEELSNTAEKVSVESRPEYITEKNMVEIHKMLHSIMFEIGIGLETANDIVRTYAVNKGFTFAQYQNATKIIKKNGGNTKTYLLIKPPFLTEKEAIQDCVQSVQTIIPFTDMISFNPVNVQRHTVVEYLWRRKQYRPAWLWSVAEILRQSKRIAGDKRLACDIVGGGSMRGAHNCGVCDNRFHQVISSFSLSQDPKVFDGLDCDCKEKWLDQLELEQFGFGSLSNIPEGKQ